MSNRNWDSLPTRLSDAVIKTIEQLKFKSMTPVQATCIPLFQSKKDVAAEAVTGSGKTLAFLIPALEMMIQRDSPWKQNEIGTVIISPTRELAQQISDVLEHFLKNIPFKQLLFVGGTPVENDVKNFLERGANIIVATPGRFEDLLINQKSLNLIGALKPLEMLVLDEADRLLDLGFQNSLDNILKMLPRQRRTGLFSATQTKQVENLVRAGLRNPVVVSVREKAGHTQSTPSALTNYYMFCPADDKLNSIVGFIKNQGSDKKFIVFTCNCACVQWFQRIFSQFLPNVFCIYGKMGKKRNKVLRTFEESEGGVLVCTDVVARGIDIPEVDWVVQLEPPSNAAAFVHRVGRTARCGQQGSSLLMLLPSEDAYIEFIQRNQKVVLEEMKPDWEVVDTISASHALQLKDRNDFDLANRAFVSFVQSYSKHECSLILRVKDLPMGLLAKGFGLLKLPKMPELKNADVSEFAPTKIDFNTLCYKDKAKEAARQKKLQVYLETKQWPSKKGKKRVIQTTPWENTKKRKLEKQERRKSRHDKIAKRTEKGLPKKKRKAKVSVEDIESLAKDIALIKKMKKKKISSVDFEKEFAGMSD